MENIIIYTDGGARGNPGPAGIGVVITQSVNGKAQNVKEISKFIGNATNNQAEYAAVIEALRFILENYNSGETALDFMIDSELIVEQLNGNYKVKHDGLKPLYNEARDLIMKVGGSATFMHIRREKNKEADKLVNKALDKQMKGDS